MAKKTLSILDKRSVRTAWQIHSERAEPVITGALASVATELVQRVAELPHGTDLAELADVDFVEALDALVDFSGFVSWRADDVSIRMGSAPAVLADLHDALRDICSTSA
jgi:hypothetical protein